MITVVYDQGGDWMALYKNGRLQLEGHSFSAPAVYQIADVEYDVIYDGVAETGSFPERLEDVVRS